MQGARLTAWELSQRGIDCTLICDSMAAQVMREGRVAAVIVGADRVAANGAAANKIGTYGVAVAAAAHSIPFYVAAPASTFDLSLAEGDNIPIEQRAADEVTHFGSSHVAPDKRRRLQSRVRRHAAAAHSRPHHRPRRDSTCRSRSRSRARWASAVADREARRDSRPQVSGKSN